MLQTYKICNRIDRVEPELLFTRVGANPDRQTRFTTDPMNITVKRSRLEVRKNSYAVRTAGEWNALSHDTKTCRTVAMFKNAIKIPRYPGRSVEGPTR